MTNINLDSSLENSNNLVFIDANLDNYQSLIAGIDTIGRADSLGLASGSNLVILDPTQDGINQITQTLENYDQLDSIQIFSHGQAGSLQLGSTNLSSHNLDNYSSKLTAWSDSLTENGDILLFGCNLGGSEMGVDLIDNLSVLTNADIAASNDLTGNSLLGGDWDLEITTGEIEADIAINADTRNSFEGVLMTYNGNQYQLTSANLTWAEAQAEAAALGGNLVTINDTAEQTWLESNFGTSQRLWTGFNDQNSEGNFEWVSGQNSGYSNWLNNKPDNLNGVEDFGVFSWNLNPSNQTNLGKWNDWRGDRNLQGIIEIGDDNSLPTETFTFNGSEYRYTTSAINWQQAQAEAVALGGNLVTINNAGEQAWLESTFGTGEKFWTGFNDQNNEGNFQWVSGQNSSYSNWLPNKPDNRGGNEDFGVLSWNPNPGNQANLGKWNDWRGDRNLRGIIEIDNEDPIDSGVIGLETNSYEVNEADGTVDVTILRTQGSDGTVTVDYRTVDAAATAGEDYTAVNGTATFADGETSQTITIPIADDSEVEGVEDFSFTIDNVVGGATLLAPRTALVNIADNDSTVDTFTYNGNQYLLTSGELTWTQAQAEAQSLGGNLVSVNDALEETWLKSTFGESLGFWIGINDVASEGNFEWVSGQPVTYTNWAPGEPNNGDGNQDFGWINYGATRQWDDNFPDRQLRGIIEIGDSNPTDNNGTGNGLRGEYFNNIDFTDSTVTRIDSTVDFDWDLGSPDSAISANTFSVRWTGEIESRYSETYTFRTTTDDGVRLWINDQLIIDGFIDQSPTSYEGTIDLVAGERADIRLEYYENGGGAVAQLSWFSDSQNLEVVPQSQLYGTVDPEPVLNSETVIDGLNQPTSIEWTPNGDRFFVAEKGGVIKVSQNGELLDSSFIDLSAQVNATSDRGLLDIAVHPDFFNGSPYVYALYTYDPPEVFQNSGLAGEDGNGNRASRLTRITADASTNFTTAVTGSEVVILGSNSTWDNFNGFVNSTNDFNEAPAGILADGTNLEDFLASDSQSHSIGSVEFGPDGALYVSNGDGTSYNRVDPRTVRVQDVDNLSGKIIRIDPITGDGLADNPFYNGDPNANRSKVYQLGLRNPFRITVDPRNGDVYVGDVGWTQWEEINSAGAGANFGWPYYEGGNGNSLQTGGYRDLAEAQAFYNSGQSVEPSILALNHSADGINAIVLGDIYTGNALPEEYQGDLFFNDLGQGIVYNVSFDNQGNVTGFDTFTTGAEIVVQIIEAPDGSLYYVDLDDGIVGRWFFS